MENLKNYSDIQDRIIKITDAMYYKGKVIDFDYLLNICVREIRADKNYILLALYELEKSKKILFGKKTTRNFILANKTRSVIFNYIKQMVSVRYRDLKDNLDLNPGVIQWNLEMLLRFGCIKTVRFSKYPIYTTDNYSDELAIICTLIRNSDIRSIILKIFEEPLQINDLVNETGISYSSIASKIKTLIDTKILEYSLNIDKKILRLNNNFKQALIDFVAFSKLDYGNPA